MDRDANYFAVGAFVLTVVAMAIAFIFWYTDQEDKRSYSSYEIYFQGSVSGLTVGSPVRYLGVDVGKVKRILLDPLQPKRVEVIADIESTAPLDSRTLASLSLQGVTGLLFIDLEQDRKPVEAGPLEPGQRYPVIRSAPSDFDVLLSSLPALTTHTIELVDRFNQVFSDENVHALKATLENARAASERLPATIRGTEELVGEMRQASREVQGAAADLRAIAGTAAPDLTKTLSNIRQATDTLATTTGRLDRLVAENGPGITHFTDQSLPAFERLLRETRDAAHDVRELSRSLKENPSQLIYEPNDRGLTVPK